MSDQEVDEILEDLVRHSESIDEKEERLFGEVLYPRGGPIPVRYERPEGSQYSEKTGPAGEELADCDNACYS